eukprot:CAMPEP_0171451118 /NCGR_PEP_ID=MMETSP0881-20121228/40982_1 /TAXON_ID=67004 /ORGANISM="Thalassiosira weissflogii, Strain CCMP1336" /LENGTH=729 /DNA_ID=CAMNT_0011975599 /DNA_START=73 /DNA_END=2262 /DNA_ORIENTATION=+
MKPRPSPSKSTTVLLLCFTTVQRIDRAASVFEVRQVPPRLPKQSHAEDREANAIRRFDPVPARGDFQFADAENNVHANSENPSQLPSLAPSFIPSESSPSSEPEPDDEDPSEDLCVSIVAVAGTPDLDYFHSGNKDRHFHDEFIFHDSNNFYNIEKQKQKGNTTNLQKHPLRQSQRQRQLHRKREHSDTGEISSKIIGEYSSKIYSEKEDFACELSNGEFVPVTGSPSRMDLLRQLLNNGQLISYETTIEGMTLTNSANSDYQLMSKSSGISEKEAMLPESDLVLKPSSFHGLAFRDNRADDNVSAIVDNELGNNLATNRRGRYRSNTNRNGNLAKFEGVKRVLVVRVVDSEGRAHADSAEVISDKIFGTAGDQENMIQQFRDCSFGKLTLTHEPATSANSVLSHLSAPGVIEATIPVSLMNTTRAVIRNQVTQVVENKLGLRLAENFDHVMYILQKCYVQCGWGAYAYVNSWNSVYQGNYYRFPGVQLHEIGHNMNLGHSGGLDETKKYGDHTCLMGNPLYSDTKSRMCYNPAKNFQFASGGNWYDPKFTMNFDITKKRRNKVLRRKIVGIADYDNNPDGHPVVIKLETDTDEDYFLGFNRAYGVNSDNKQADNLVTLIKAGSNGLSYSQSWLLATLDQGQSYKFRTWKGMRRRDLIITVNAIDVTNSNPGYADVTLKYIRSSKKNNPKPKPAPSPTASSPSISAPSAPSRENPEGRNPDSPRMPRYT